MDIKKYIFYSIILEADSGAVVQRVALRTDDIPIGEQTVAQVSYIFYN
jgi:coatomer subunit zeta